MGRLTLASVPEIFYLHFLNFIADSSMYFPAMGKLKQKAERRANDHYVTPDWSIRRFLEVYSPPSRNQAIPQPLRILDPCAAAGELLRVVQPFFPGAVFAACEIQPQFEQSLIETTEGAVVVGDFLQSLDLLKSCNFDFVITNPPYGQAIEFIRGCLEVAPVVAMLLRVNFVASRERRDYLAQVRPGIFVLPNRPSFTGGTTDATEYAWFVFGDRDVAGQIDWLAETSIEEIRAANDMARVIHGVADAAAALAAGEIDEAEELSA